MADIYTAKQTGAPKLPQIEDEFYLIGRGATVAQTNVQLIPDASQGVASILTDKAYVIVTEWWHWYAGTSVGVGYSNTSMFAGIWDGSAWGAGQNNGSTEVANSQGAQGLLTYQSQVDPAVDLVLGGDTGKTIEMNYIWRSRVMIFDDTDITLLP